MSFKDKRVPRNKRALGNVHVQGQEGGRKASRRERKREDGRRGALVRGSITELVGW